MGNVINGCGNPHLSRRHLDAGGDTVIFINGGGWARALAGILGFCGILIIARPGAQEISWGIVAAAGSAICFATTAIFTKKLTRKSSMIGIMFWLVVMQAVFGLICAGYDGQINTPSLTVWPWLILIGAAGLFAHFCLTRALSIAPASIVMPFDFARLPLIAIVGMLFYNEPLDAFVFLGGAVIFMANVINIRASTALLRKNTTIS